MQRELFTRPAFLSLQIQPVSRLDLVRFGLRQSIANAAVIEDVFRRRDVACVEGAEFRVAGTRFVKPHLIDDFLEKLRVACPECDTPLPIFQTNPYRDQLADLTGKLRAEKGRLNQFSPTFLFLFIG